MAPKKVVKRKAKTPKKKVVTKKMKTINKKQEKIDNARPEFDWKVYAVLLGLMLGSAGAWYWEY